VTTSHSSWSDANRLGGLRRFAVAITVLNLLGHTLLGFEQSWAQPLVSLATAYGVELLLEYVDARVTRRAPRFLGGMRALTDFLLSAHISGLAVAMLLYSNERLAPIAFAAAVAIGSKSILRVTAGGASRHVFNPSNFGITVTLLIFPWVGIAPPYHFTENLSGLGDWLLPGIIVVSGTFLNARFTHRLPLIASWLGVFAAQAVVRSVVFGTPLVAPLVPMTGMAFVLYTFYMVTDPATTPSSTRAQVVFGASVAAVYGCLLALHVVFGLFFALTIVSAGRGLAHYLRGWAAGREAQPLEVRGQVAVQRVEP
jgi:Na+-translocating ferredoxin:NAD+ oxidoreductase RnfD subunit